MYKNTSESINNTRIIDSFLKKSKEEFANDFYDLFQERLEEKAYHIYNLIEKEIKDQLIIHKGVTTDE